MELCFDATRFGFGLQESLKLAAQLSIPALEYSFNEFQVAKKKGLKLDSIEKNELEQIALSSKELKVKIACLKLNYPLKVSNKNSINQFSAMLTKIVELAQLFESKYLIFYLEAESKKNWLTETENILSNIFESIQDTEISFLLSLSTPPQYRNKSLRLWRAIEPEEWRELLAGLPLLGLSFSVADCAWQGIDYLRILSGLCKGIAHVEACDVEINRQIIADNGLFGPLWWRYKTIGKGQVDWAQFIEALKLYDFNGYMSIQLEDENKTDDDILLRESLEAGLKIISPLIKY